MNTKKMLLTTALSLGLLGSIIVPSASAAESNTYSHVQTSNFRLLGVGPSPEITPIVEVNSVYYRTAKLPRNYSYALSNYPGDTYKVASGNVTVSTSGLLQTYSATNGRVEIYGGTGKLRMVYTIKVS
ncbi:hypothetical protein ASL14_21805 [Paenibacillus sp. IHB B 3084]|uniref:hypothetical protein n=1 Tax=Paenibacillus sp. IHB B 3084 TaxID=867076 RepID=UPI000720EE51|nr:hypothetical protein [Paenibacillus sp. IHB B 3084]ALP38416.1 hypothetical protein ASL14_21805 [Paenibacillus sp. IHB B 3084]